MAARSSVKSFHLASFLFFFFSYWQKGSDLLVLIRHFPALKLHSPSLSMDICLLIKHPFHLLLTVFKVNHDFIIIFLTKISQFLDKIFHRVWGKFQWGYWFYLILKNFTVLSQIRFEFSYQSILPHFTGRRENQIIELLCF